MTEDLKTYKRMLVRQKHSLSTSDIVVGVGATQKLIDYIKERYDAASALIVCDANTEKYARPIADALGCRTFTHVADARANEIETARLTSYIKSNSLSVSVAVACGSGCIHDITRYCAYENGSLYIVPDGGKCRWFCIRCRGNDDARTEADIPVSLAGCFVCR